MGFLGALDLCGAICGVVASCLSSHNDIRHWPISIISFVVYGVVFACIGMLGNSFVQFILLAVSLMGWRSWEDCSAVVRWASRYEVLIALGLGVCVAITIMLIQLFLGQLNLTDAFSAAFLLLAIYALGCRYIQVWLLFFCLDLYFCTTMIQTGLYFSAMKYLLYLFFTQLGYFNWYTLIDRDPSFMNKDVLDQTTI